MALKTWTCQDCGKKVTGDEADAVRRFVLSKLEDEFLEDYEDKAQGRQELEDSVTELARDEGLGRCLACMAVVDWSPKAILTTYIENAIKGIDESLFVWHEVEMSW